MLFLVLLTIPVTAGALLFTRKEYRERGKLSLLGLGFVCLMLLVPNLILEFATTYQIPSTFIDYSGIVLGVVGLGLCLIGIISFQSMRKTFCIEPGQLTTVGPYRWSRNPQYLGWFLFLLGFSLNDWSWWCLPALLASGISIHLLVLIEEEHLQRTFGDQYRQFSQQVPRYFGFSKSNM
jgi:protein-S-isoprenylcysteine O-methyltransferase Ste14